MPRKDKKKQNTAPKLTKEQMAEQARNEYRTELDQITAKVKNQYDTLGQFYGPKGNMPKGMAGKADYDALSIQTPPNMDDIFVTAVTLGAMMDPSRLDRNMTASSFVIGTTTYKAFNQNFLVENVPSGDQRHGEFPPLMLQGRVEAQKAISQLIDRNPEKAYEYVNQFVNFAAMNIRDASAYTSGDLLKDNDYTGTRTAMRLAAKLISTEPYMSHIQISEYDRMKLMAFGNESAVKEQLLTEKAELMKNPPAANTKEREDAVAELMFKEYLIATRANSDRAQDAEQNQVLTEILDQNGVDVPSTEYTHLYSTPLSVATFSVPVMNNVKKNRITDNEVILSRPDGVDTLRNMYMESIRNTDTFKNLVAAEGNAFQDQMMELDRTARNGFRSFPNVKANDEAEHYHELSGEEFRRSNQETSQIVGEILEAAARNANRVTAYDARQLQRNRQRVQNSLNDFTEKLVAYQKGKGQKEATNEELLNTALQGDKNLQEIYKGLDSIVNQARSMEKSGKASQDNLRAYTATIDRTLNSVQDFFRERGESAPVEEQPVFRMLRKLNRDLAANRYGIMKPQRQKEREEIFRLNANTYEKPSPAGIDAMLNIRKEQFASDQIGVFSGRKQLIGKAVTATEKLADMIKAGRPLTGETKTEAVGYLKDILAERLYAKAEGNLTQSLVHFAERYATKVADKIPEFTGLTEKLTLTDIGQIVFEGRADRLIEGYTSDKIYSMFAAEKDLEAKAVTDRLKEEEQQRKTVLEEQKKQEERDKYRESTAKRKADHLEPLKMFHRFYGSNPQMPEGIRLSGEYNDLKIENPPKDLDENTITAIVIGSIMRKDRLDYRMTSSSFQAGTTTFLEFNRNFLIENIINNSPDTARQGSVGLAMLEGRKDAMQAIEEYRNGHPEKAKEMLGTFIDFASQAMSQTTPPTSMNIMVSNENSVQKTLHQLGAQMVGKPPFFAQGTQSKVKEIQGKANEQTVKAMNRIYATKHDILTQPKPAGSPERMKEIEDLLFDQYLMSTRYYSVKEKQLVGDNWKNRLMEKYGLDNDYDPNTYDNVADSMQNVDTQQMWNCRDNILTDHEVLMSSEGGIEKLKALYLPEIRKTKLYQDLISAKGTKYEDLLRESDRETNSGLQSFNSVQLPHLAEPYNRENAPAFQKRNRELELITDEIAVKAAREAQNFNGYDKASMQDNAEHLEYLNNMMKRDILNDKSLSDTARSVIGNLKKAVKDLSEYADKLVKKKDKITISDMMRYKNIAEKAENLAEGYVTGYKAPAEGVEKQVYLAVKRVGFMVAANKELMIGPARNEERRNQMKTIMDKPDGKNVEAFRAKHPNIDKESADYRYGVLSDNQIRGIYNISKGFLSDAYEGASQDRKKLIKKSETATKELTQMMMKGEDYIRSHQDKIRDCLKDVFAERILAKLNKERINAPEADVYAKRMTEHVPEFREATQNITIGTIGSFLFENQGDELLKNYNKAQMMKLQDDVILIRLNADLAEIGRREEERNRKNEIIDDGKSMIHEEPKNVIHEEKNVIIEEKGEKLQLDDLMDQLAAGSAADKEAPIQKKDMAPAPEKKKSKKGEVKKEEEPREEPKEEPKEVPLWQIKSMSDKLEREEPKIEEPKIEEPKIEEPKIEEPKIEESKIVEEEINTDSKQRVEEEINTNIKKDEDLDSESERSDGFGELRRQWNLDGKNTGRKEREVDSNNLIREDDSDDKIRLMDNTQEFFEGDGTQTFVNKVHLFSRTRQNLITAMKEDLANLVGVSPKRLNSIRNAHLENLDSDEQKQFRELWNCLVTMENKEQSPQMMWNNLQNLSMQMRYLDPSKATKYQLMTAILGESLKPLTALKTDFEPLQSRNAADATINEIYKAVENVKKDYMVNTPTVGETKEAYLNMEAKAKAKFLLWNRLSNACGQDINQAPANHDPDEVLMDTDRPSGIHEAAVRCVAKSFIAKADAEATTAAEVSGLTALVMSGGFDSQVKELEKNPIFKKVAEKYPDKYYSRWQKVVDNAEEQKQNANTNLSRLEEAGGLGGLADYVAHGSRGNQLLLVNDASPQTRMVQNARLAQVLANKLLADPQFTTLRQAVGAGVIKSQDVALEAMEFAERKNIRMIDRNGNLDRDFVRKLRNGDLMKDLVKSQTQFLSRAKKRDPEQKKEIQKKLNSVKSLPKLPKGMLI